MKEERADMIEGQKVVHHEAIGLIMSKAGLTRAAGQFKEPSHVFDIEM